MKIFDSEQIRAWDSYTIRHEPVASIDLMNRASAAFADWFINLFPDTRRPVYIFVGPGNNGGDGLAVARLLFRMFYDTKVFLCRLNDTASEDFKAQLAVLPADIERVDGFAWMETARESGFPSSAGLGPSDTPIVIDALFGSGLNRAPEGPWADLISFLNSLPGPRVSIDLPSGMFTDQPTPGPCIEADYTLSFQAPKRAFMFPVNARFTGVWHYTDIRLHPDFERQTPTPFYFFTREDAVSLTRPRAKFSHKGSFGHALLIAGGFGKMGAALLAARGCLRAGAGLLTVKAPLCGHDVLQTAVPEAMYLPDPQVECVSELPGLSPYKAVGAGPGLGTSGATARVIEQLLETCEVPLVLDADALNIVSQKPELWRKMPRNAILTPHPGEFERLFGKSADDFSRNALLREKAQEHGVFIALKGAHTAVACPDGSCWFNSSGNPGMATGGSGDVLTGIVTGLLAQGYTPLDAARLGVYLHGAAGDAAANNRGMNGLIAGDIPEALPEAWKNIES